MKSILVPKMERNLSVVNTTDYKNHLLTQEKVSFELKESYLFLLGRLVIKENKTAQLSLGLKRLNLINNESNSTIYTYGQVTNTHVMNLMVMYMDECNQAIPVKS